MRHARHAGFALVSMFIIAACGDDKPAESPASSASAPPPIAPTPTIIETPKVTPPPLSELERKTSEGLAVAINAHDAKQVASFYTESAIVKVAGFPDLVGRDSIQSDWQTRFDRVADSRSMATRVFVKGDVVIAEWTFTGTAKAMPGGGKTDKPIGAVGVDVAWFTPEGLIKEQHMYMDMNTLASQMGMSKQKARAVPALPTGTPAIVVATGSDAEQKDVDASKKMFDAFEKKSDADFLAGATDDVTWDDFTAPETTKGKAANRKWFSAFTTAFPDIKATTQNAWGIGDFVIAEGTISGTQKGAFFGMPPKGKQVNLHGLDVVQFKDGKIIAGRSYGNGLEMAMQLGLVPPPGGGKPGDVAGKPDSASRPNDGSSPAGGVPAKK